MRPRGRLEWKGAKFEWPKGPAQWILTCVGALDTLIFTVLVARIPPSFELLLLNLIWFGSLVLLSLLYRLAGRRPRSV